MSKSSERYRLLLTRPEWKAFTEKVKERRGHACEECKSQDRLQVHHIYYVRGKLPWEYEFNQVRVLCHKHHKEAHDREDEAIKLMWEVYSDGGFYFLTTLKQFLLKTHLFPRRSTGQCLGVSGGRGINGKL